MLRCHVDVLAARSRGFSGGASCRRRTMRAWMAEASRTLTHHGIHSRRPRAPFIRRNRNGHLLNRVFHESERDPERICWRLD